MSDHSSNRTPRGDWRDGLPSDIDGGTRAGLPAPGVVGAIRFDSREVEPGDVFVCIEGERFDGHEFASQAVSRGASVVVAARGRADGLRGALDVPVIEVDSPRRVLSSLAAAHEGYPARKLTVIGVTGTDGKSTTCFLTQAALEGAGVRAGLLSTIGSRLGGSGLGGAGGAEAGASSRRSTPRTDSQASATANATRLTTQEAPVVQRLLAEMVEAGSTHAVVEATSHGLALDRLADCEFDVGVLTNLTSDHLDFHGTLAAYRAAKARLFEMLNARTSKRVDRLAVLNRDDPSWQYFALAARVGTAAGADASTAALLTYGVRSRDADLRAREVIPWRDGSTFALVTDEWEIDASVPLPGAFNVLNATAAIAVAAGLGLDPVAAAAGVARCPGVPGRMQRVPGAPFPVIVDYAHTPEAMRQVLAQLAPLVAGRVLVVFGCAGERSRERRSGLGRAVAEAGAYAVLTEEDPRSEDPEAIIEEIAAALRAAGAVEGPPSRDGSAFERVPDRRAAIARALALATLDDLVLLAGKGHESTIERASGAVPWDEAAVAAALIAERFAS